MTRDDIIRMAREAGLGTVLSHTTTHNVPRVWIEGADWHDELERFAELVAAHEREACAKLCETLEPLCYDTTGYTDCAAAIRARKD
jgi:hypothetical protein